ncbi:MAG: primosome assembly protein PriA [Lapillicoccus sp.]
MTLQPPGLFPASVAPAGLPVAAVVVDTGLPHLDRVFEYAVPPELAAGAVPGARVRVRFAGRDLDGFVVERRERAEHEGRLAQLRRVVSPEPVLTPEVLASARAVADRCAGVLGDVLRLAVPRRHATAERALALEVTPPVVAVPDPGPWAAYPAGESLLRRIGAGEAPAAAWLALPGRLPADDWPRALAVAAATAVAAGRGAVIVVPDHRDVDRVDAELTAVLGPAAHVRLTADQGPQARYTAFLKILRGHVRCVVGTRAAAFAPVHQLGLVAWWDDGDDLLEEPRAPYPHVRDVLRERAARSGAALLSAGFARSVPVALEVRDGRMVSVVAAASVVRQAAPRVVVAGDEIEQERDGPAARAHLPSVAWRTAKAALEHGPVLVQVPRRGYRPSLSCQECREPARCPRCHGPMGQPGPNAPPRCRWCGSDFGQAGFTCPDCGGRTLRSSVVGAGRTAEELGRAFPETPLRTSGAGEVLARVGPEPAIVISTPGAEPVAEGRYAACLLLDAWALLDRPALDASMEALRRWTGAAALTRGASEGGVIVLAGAPTHTTLAAVEALVRWDPAWLAGREVEERAELGLPPLVTMAQVIGPRPAVQAALELATLPEGVARLGPLPYRAGRAGPGRRPDPTGDAAGGSIQVLLRTERAQGPALAKALATMRAGRSARKELDSVAVRMDPVDGG